MTFVGGRRGRFIKRAVRFILVSSVAFAALPGVAFAYSPPPLTSHTNADGPDRDNAALAAAWFGDCTNAANWISCRGTHAHEGADFGAYYNDFENEPFGSDCTNFVSSSLRVGGGLARTPVKMNTARNDPNSWYSVASQLHADHPLVDYVRRTNTWTAVTQFEHYWLYTRHDVWISHDNPSRSINSADLGDIVVYDFGYTSQPNYDHTTMETSFGSSKQESGYFGDLISQHSPGRTNHSWNYAYTSNHNALARTRMLQRGFIVMHWTHGFDGWFDHFGAPIAGGGGGPIPT